MKYLFEARLANGDVIRQIDEDLSAVDPSKSAWSDVVARRNEVVSFTLFAGEVAAAAVFMDDGHFELCGNAFMAVPGRLDQAAKDPPAGGRYLPMYWRVVSRAFGGAEVIYGFSIGWDYVMPDGSIKASQMIIFY